MKFPAYVQCAMVSVFRAVAKTAECLAPEHLLSQQPPVGRCIGPKGLGTLHTCDRDSSWRKVKKSVHFTQLRDACDWFIKQSRWQVAQLCEALVILKQIETALYHILVIQIL